MFFDNFSNLCEQKGVSCKRATQEIGLSNSICTKWRKGAVPNGETLNRIAEYFGVSVEYLLNGENKKPAPIIESGELNRKKVFAEMLSCLPERDRIVIEHNILMLWRLAREEGTLMPSETAVDLDWIIGNLSARRDHLLGANA